VENMVKMVKVVKVKMVKIENNKACFVQLWLMLERTRLKLKVEYRRYCAYNVLKVWFGSEATDEFIWQVCHKTEIDGEQLCGNDRLLPPRHYPRQHRELIRSVVATKLGIGTRKVLLPELDAAYSEAFPNSTPINVNKKRLNIKH